MTGNRSLESFYNLAASPIKAAEMIQFEQEHRKKFSATLNQLVSVEPLQEQPKINLTFYL